MPKRLLRGVIDFGTGKPNEEELNLNYRRLIRSRFEWNNPDEQKIFSFIKDFVQANHESPSGDTIRDFFNRSNEITVIEKLEDVKAVEVHVRKNYEVLLKSLLEEQNQNKFRKLLQEVEEIVTKGKLVGKEKTVVKGFKDGVQYFNQKFYDLIPPEGTALTEGDVLQGASDAWAEYQTAKLNKDKAYGRFTGIEKIDVACHGIKPGELWIHAAATGELKTSFAMTWAYNLVTRYRANVLYVSLEMKYEHLRRLACSMHTSNGVFRAQGYTPLEYQKIRDGELSPEEEIFYQKALRDFETNPEYCKFNVWAPDRKVTIGDVRVYAELLHKTQDIGLVIIDHCALVKPTEKHRDYTIALNSIVEESKQLALHFNGGEGIPVLALFQINRQGKDSVDKQIGKDDEGVYRTSHLSYANEAERSADYVTTTYLNPDLRKQGVTIMANMKNRDNEPFGKFKARVDFKCRRLFTWDMEDQVDIGHSEVTQAELEMMM